MGNELSASCICAVNYERWSTYYKNIFVHVDYLGGIPEINHIHRYFIMGESTVIAMSQMPRHC